MPRSKEDEIHNIAMIKSRFMKLKANKPEYLSSEGLIKILAGKPLFVNRLKVIKKVRLSNSQSNQNWFIVFTSVLNSTVLFPFFVIEQNNLVGFSPSR